MHICFCSWKLVISRHTCFNIYNTLINSTPPPPSQPVTHRWTNSWSKWHWKAEISCVPCHGPGWHQPCWTPPVIWQPAASISVSRVFHSPLWAPPVIWQPAASISVNLPQPSVGTTGDLATSCLHLRESSTALCGHHRWSGNQLPPSLWVFHSPPWAPPVIWQPAASISVSLHSPLWPLKVRSC